MGAWIWEIVRTRNYDRNLGEANPTDWSDGDFVAIFFLFMLNWVASSLWQYIILYFLGCFTNSPRKAANYAVSFLSSFMSPFANEDLGCFPWLPRCRRGHMLRS
jgi:hypothetical protein